MARSRVVCGLFSQCLLGIKNTARGTCCLTSASFSPPSPGASPSGNPARRTSTTSLTWSSTRSDPKSPVPCPPPSASSSLSLLLLLSAPSASHRPDDRPSGQERLAARRAPARGSPASHLRAPGARGGQQPSGMATARIGARSGLRQGGREGLSAQSSHPQPGAHLAPDTGVGRPLTTNLCRAPRGPAGRAPHATLGPGSHGRPLAGRAEGRAAPRCTRPLLARRFGRPCP